MDPEQEAVLNRVFVAQANLLAQGLIKYSVNGERDIELTDQGYEAAATMWINIADEDK